MRWPKPLLPVLLLVCAPAAAHAQYVHVDLVVGSQTNLVATLESMRDDAQSAAESGTATVRLKLVDDPVFGLVAESVEFTSAALAVGDLSWSVDNGFESLVAGLTDGAFDVSSGPIAASPVATNTSEIPVSDIALRIIAGDFTATGTVLDTDFDIARDFSRSFPPLGLVGVATVTTTPLVPSPVVNVRVTLPIDDAIPVDPPFLVTWVRVTGTVELTGQIPALPEVPVGVHPLWIAGALLLAALAILRQREWALAGAATVARARNGRR